ncbi:MAG: cytidine deaminase [bacterium]
MEPAKLLESARDAMKRSYSIYSHFPVGAAVVSHDGRVFSAANVENASFGLTICAERAAVARMVAEAGFRTIVAVAVVAEKQPDVVPCGACLQVLAEFGAPDCVVLGEDESGGISSRRLMEFLPFAFNLGKPKTKS